jgi:hypothetical protein
LRFAGNIVLDDGVIAGLANTSAELRAVRAQVDPCPRFVFTGPGFHDEQLSDEEFFAWHRSECAARLESMAEARGRPRPTTAHPDAEPDDPDGVHGGEKPEDAGFDCEDALPGGDADVAQDVRAQVDPDVAYASHLHLSNAQVFEAVHRHDIAEAERGKRSSNKRDMFEKFMREHSGFYSEARRPRAVEPATPGPPTTADTDRDRAAAAKHQAALLDDALEEDSCDRGLATRSTEEHSACPEGTVRPLLPAELPLSPKELAAELIAKSGVWKSKEQYLATLFILEPLQLLWEQALQDGKVDDLKEHRNCQSALELCPVRPIFLHGPGGSGKTFCMVEVVLKVYDYFLGAKGVKAIAATNSNARMLLGKTMHAASKMVRGQSLKASSLKPTWKQRKALEREWQDSWLLLIDEIGLASPPLLAGTCRRVFHGRSRMLRLPAETMMEHMFGDVPVQVALGDLMQLLPVMSHSLLQALSFSPVPDADKKKKTKMKKTAEDEDGFNVFRSMCKNVVLFTGTHRFLDTELPALLEIMQTPGGKAVPHALRKAVLGRIQAGPDDPRLGQDFAVDGRSGFFAFGAFAAIRWEQVARMTQLHILQMASKSTGPVAACNKADGKHDLHRTVPGQRQGQLVYYFTAVDRFKHNHYNRDRDTRLRALAFVNLSKSGGLPGMCGTFLGMRVRLTRKVQPETPSILSLHSCTHF